MLKETDQYFLQQIEPAKSCLLFLRGLVLGLNSEVTEVWRYGMPFYCYKGKRFCYLWVHKKSGIPYIGIVEGKLINHPSLLQEQRSRMKIMLIDPDVDIPVDEVKYILNMALDYCKMQEG